MSERIIIRWGSVRYAHQCTSDERIHVRRRYRRLRLADKAGGRNTWRDRTAAVDSASHFLLVLQAGRRVGPARPRAVAS